MLGSLNGFILAKWKFRGADLIFLETFFRFDELALAVRAVREVCDLPVVGLLTFATERPPHPYEEQAKIVDELADLDLLAIGVELAGRETAAG